MPSDGGKKNETVGFNATLLPKMCQCFRFDTLKTKHDSIQMWFWVPLSLSLSVQFDANGDGQISLIELREAMKKLMGEQVTNREISEILRDVDLNGDGLVDFEGKINYICIMGSELECMQLHSSSSIFLSVHYLVFSEFVRMMSRWPAQHVSLRWTGRHYATAGLENTLHCSEHRSSVRSSTRQEFYFCIKRKKKGGKKTLWIDKKYPAYN